MFRSKSCAVLGLPSISNPGVIFVIEVPLPPNRSTRCSRELMPNVRRLTGPKAFLAKEFSGNKWIMLSWIFTTIFVCAIYPAILFAEFWNAPGGRTLELFKLYPHMALMPSLLFWAIFWLIASSLSAAWTDKSLRSKIKRRIALCLLITIVVTYQEATSSPIMLFELRPDRGSDSTWLTLYANTREMLKKPRPQTAADEATEEQVKMGQSLSHDYWREKHRFSITRPFYIAAFFLSIFALANVVAALSYFPKLNAKQEDRYLFQLLGGFFCYALWFPARFYYNLEIKSTLVGFSEKLPGRDIVLYFVGAVFLVFVCVRLISEVDRFRRILTLLGVFALPLVSMFATKSLGNVFGLSSKPLTWLTLFGVFIFLFIIFRSVLPVPEGLSKRSHKRSGKHGKSP
jgi:hypothetical protein